MLGLTFQLLSGDRGVLKINYPKMHGTEADVEWLMLSTQLCAPFVCISDCMFWALRAVIRLRICVQQYLTCCCVNDPQLSQAVSLSEIDCFHALWSGTLPKSICILLKTCSCFVWFLRLLYIFINGILQVIRTR